MISAAISATALLSTLCSTIARGACPGRKPGTLICLRGLFVGLCKSLFNLFRVTGDLKLHSAWVQVFALYFHCVLRCGRNPTVKDGTRGRQRHAEEGGFGFGCWALSLESWARRVGLYTGSTQNPTPKPKAQSPRPKTQNPTPKTQDPPPSSMRTIFQTCIKWIQENLGHFCAYNISVTVKTRIRNRLCLKRPHLTEHLFVRTR